MCHRKPKLLCSFYCKPRKHSYKKELESNHWDSSSQHKAIPLLSPRAPDDDLVSSWYGQMARRGEQTVQAPVLHYSNACLERARNMVCLDLEKNENAGQQIAPDRSSIFVDKFDAAMTMLMSDIQMAKHSQTAGNFAMAPMTYNKFCPPLPKVQPPTMHLPEGATTAATRSAVPPTRMRETARTCLGVSSKSDEQVEFSKSKGMLKLVAGKAINAHLNKPPVIEYNGKRTPLCLKHCLAGLACQFKSCRFHHLSLAAAQSLNIGGDVKRECQGEPALGPAESDAVIDGLTDGTALFGEVIVPCLCPVLWRQQPAR
jgi:hypothetical protein